MPIDATLKLIIPAIAKPRYLVKTGNFSAKILTLPATPAAVLAIDAKAGKRTEPIEIPTDSIAEANSLNAPDVEFLYDCNKAGLEETRLMNKKVKVELENSLIGVNRSDHPIMHLALNHFSTLDQGRSRVGTFSDGPYDCFRSCVRFMFGYTSGCSHLAHAEYTAEQMGLKQQKKETYDPIKESISSNNHGFMVGHDLTWDKSKPEYTKSLSEFQELSKEDPQRIQQENIESAREYLAKKFSVDKQDVSITKNNKGQEYAIDVNTGFVRNNLCCDASVQEALDDIATTFEGCSISNTQGWKYTKLSIGIDGLEKIAEKSKKL